MIFRFVAAALLGLTSTLAVAVESSCRPEPRFDLASPQARVIVLGEGTHGTVEVPAFVTGVLCAYAKANRPVLLAWEHPRGRQDALNAFIDSVGTPDDRSRLVAAVLRSSTGQSSRAILEMLDAVRSLRKSGARIAVAMVDSAETDLLEPLYDGENAFVLFSQGQRQRLMANVVETRALQYPDHAVLFFTSHASRTVGDLAPGYESATLLLSRRMPVQVLGFAYAGGQAWRCQGRTVQEAVCKPYDLRATEGYADADRNVDLGVVTASPPASDDPDPIHVPPSAKS